MGRIRTAKVCPQPGCPKLQPCPDHKPSPWAGSTRASRLPSNWSQLRAQILKRDRYTCQACGGTRCGNQRLEVDHITRGDNHDPTNLQTLGHTPCHTEKTGTEARAARTT